MNIITKTNTSDLDLGLDSIECPYIKRVFENYTESTNNITLLTIQEFIHKSKYPIDNFMVDNFFVNLNDNTAIHSIYVTNELIEWCGFNSNVMKKQKEMFNRLLSFFEETKDYWIYSNKEYYEYFKSNPKPNYPHPDTFIGKNKTKHIVLTVQCFKMILMMLTTKRAPAIRLHYVQIEKLMIIYMQYQCIILNKSYKNEINKLKNLQHVKEYSQQQRLSELDAKLAERYRVGCIYYISEVDNCDIIKIGYTFNLQERLKQLQTAHYKELIIQHYYLTQFPYEEEQRLHTTHADKLIRGEWYKIYPCKN